MTSTAEVAFPNPQEIEGYWDWDKIHAPRPLTPLAGDAVVMAMSEGFTIAQHGFGSPLALRCRMVNNYLYAAFAPDAAFTPPTTDPAEYARALEQVAFRTGERWTNEWEPALVVILQKARTTDFDAMDDTELLAAFDEQLENHVYMWEIHGWINLSLLPATALTDFYNAEIQPSDRNEAWQLLQGYKTRSIDAGSGLWKLSRMVKDSPGLSKVFELDPVAIPAALESSDAGKALLDQLDTYLEEFGWRSDGIYELGDATWREDLTIPLNTIQGYVRLGEEHNPELAMLRATERREELASAARAKLASDPEKVRRFDELMEASKYNTRVVEDHSYWIDQMGVAALRRFFLSVGKRLTERGALNQPEDVLFLYKDEIRTGLSTARTDHRKEVAQRRAAFEGASAIVPPDHLGEPTPANPDPFFVAIVDKMLGFLPIEPSTDPSIIAGVAASPGTAQGTVKVVRTLVEASKLQQGDIMVCEMTVPTWVPLFATVRAVVADSGGILSHCAIVAREFGLPAVVGTRVGTTTLRDGMTITVDGGRGLVRIDSR